MPRALRALLPHVTHLPHFLSVIVSHLPCASHALRSTWSRVSRAPRVCCHACSMYQSHLLRSMRFVLPFLFISYA